MPASLRAGHQKITADGVVGTSGAAVVIYGIHLRSGAGGAGVVSLYDGTSTSGTLLKEETGTTNAGKSFEYPSGHVFPNGCYVDIDTNTSYVDVWYEKV